MSWRRWGASRIRDPYVVFLSPCPPTDPDRCRASDRATTRRRANSWADCEPAGWPSMTWRVTPCQKDDRSAALRDEGIEVIVGPFPICRRDLSATSRPLRSSRPASAGEMVPGSVRSPSPRPWSDGSPASVGVSRDDELGTGHGLPDSRPSLEQRLESLAHAQSAEEEGDRRSEGRSSLGGHSPGSGTAGVDPLVSHRARRRSSCRPC